MGTAPSGRARTCITLDTFPVLVAWAGETAADWVTGRDALISQLEACASTLHVSVVGEFRSAFVAWSRADLVDRLYDAAPVRSDLRPIRLLVGDSDNGDPEATLLVQVELLERWKAWGVSLRGAVGRGIGGLALEVVRGRLAPALARERARQRRWVRESEMPKDALMIEVWPARTRWIPRPAVRALPEPGPDSMRIQLARAFEAGGDVTIS